MGGCYSSAAQQSVQSRLPVISINGPQSAIQVGPGTVDSVQSLLDPHQPSITISWQPPDTLLEITWYTVRFKQSNSSLYEYASVPQSQNQACLTIRNGLEPLALYTFEVRAETRSMYGEWSPPIQDTADWYCRYPPCYSSRMRLKGFSSMGGTAVDVTPTPWASGVTSLPFLDEATYQNTFGMKPKIYDFCSKEHKIRFDAKYCLYPECAVLAQEQPGGVSTDAFKHFCGHEHWNKAVQEGHCFLVSVDPSSDQFSQVCIKFQKSWAKEKGECPAIHGILSIINPRIDEQLKAYQSSLPKRHQKTESYFHGTHMDCLIDKLHTTCDTDECGICGITKSGFQQKCISGRWQRFGRAFYLAPNSSKSYDYCIMRSPSSTRTPPYRGMLLCDVAAGKKHNLRRNSIFLQGPPEGYHSVYGKSKFMFLKGDLNYDELVIFNEKAICPRFIILLS